MNSTVSETGKFELPSVDSRSVMAFVSLLIAGSLVSTLFHHYMAFQETGVAFDRPRLWWEVLLNLQLLAIGMMWFSYSDRIAEPRGALRFYQQTQRFLGTLSVAVPAILLIVCVFLDGFSVRFGPNIVAIFITTAAIHLAVRYLLRQKIRTLQGKANIRQPFSFYVLYYLPAEILAVTVIMDMITGNTWCLIMAPAALYGQAGMAHAGSFLRRTRSYAVQR